MCAMLLDVVDDELVIQLFDLQAARSGPRKRGIQKRGIHMTAPPASRTIVECTQPLTSSTVPVRNPHPTGPVGPVGPTAPAAPAGPVGPAGPVMPVGPVTPEAPAAPA